METCEKMSKEEDIALRTLCFMKCFPDCIAEYPDQDDPMYHMAKRGWSYCFKKHNNHKILKELINFGRCLHEWYGQNIKTY